MVIQCKNLISLYILHDQRRVNLLVVHIYPPFTRKRVVLLYFVREVSIRLEVAIFEVSGPPGFHIKAGGGDPLSAFPKDTTSELASLFSTTSPKCWAPIKEAVDNIF